jgi:hypothetical protein
MWLHAILPGLVCAWLLMGLPIRLFSLQMREA